MKLNNLSEKKLKILKDRINSIEKLDANVKANISKYQQLFKLLKDEIGSLQIRVLNIEFTFKDLKEKNTIEALSKLLEICILNSKSNLKKIKNENI